MSFSLNEAQKTVVAHRDGPLLVVAGAGTGKTRVIVERITNLLSQGIEAKQILAVTFTEKSAAEMLDRVLEAQSNFAVELPVLTFNAFGESLLREFNTDIGLSRNFILLGESAKIVFLRQHLEELELDYYSPFSNPDGLLPDIADHFSKLKQHVITPEVYENFVSKMPRGDEAEQLEQQKHTELSRAYRHYLALSKQYNVIDYDDQIYRAIELLESRPNVRTILRKRYYTIMIDEFQDTNPMQSRLIDLLVNETQNLMVVGDDDQSIYGFRGATLANILEFKTRYPKAQQVALTENYRSTQSILDSSHKLITHNNPFRLEEKLGIDKKLHAQTEGEQATLKDFTELSLELQWIGEDISDRLEAGASPGDIAILCRRNTTAKEMSQVLEFMEIEHVVIGERYQLYKAPIVRLLVECLRTVIDSEASISLYHTLSSVLFKVEASLLADLASQAKRQHQSLEAIILSQTDGSYEPLQSAVKIIQDWRTESAVLPVGKLVYKIIDQTGYKNTLSETALSDPEAAHSIMQLSEFFKTLKEFESIALQPTTVQYLESFPVLEAAGDSNEDGTLEVTNNAISVLTIHKSKGLEWETVYIPDCTEGSFPLRARGGGIALPEALITNSSSEADEHMAEERRLMYVALTRAKENLILTYSQRHHTPTPRKPSRFLKEVFGELPETVPQDASKEETISELELLTRTPTLQKDIPLPKTMYQNDLIQVSVSQIVTFLNCPLDFYYRYILSLPEAPNPATSYGSAIHGGIEAINKALVTGEDITLEALKAELETSLVLDGYASKAQQERSKKQAMQTLESFYTQNFVLKKHIPLYVEWPFSTKIPDAQMVIRGRLDVVFGTEEGIEIRDYKTSVSVGTPEKAKQRATASTQLTLYALIWKEIHGELPKKLSLEFVDTNQIGSVGKTQRGIDSMHAKLVEMSKAIKNNQFIPGKDHRYCQHPDLG